MIIEPWFRKELSVEMDLILNIIVTLTMIMGGLVAAVIVVRGFHYIIGVI